MSRSQSLFLVVVFLVRCFAAYIAASIIPASTHIPSKCIYCAVNKTITTVHSNNEWYHQLRLNIVESSKNLLITTEKLIKPAQTQSNQQFIYDGLFGFVNISSNVYVVFIKASIPATYIHEGVREITEIEIRSVLTTSSNKSPEVNELKSLFKQHRFFFSTSAYDVTRNLQSNLLRLLDSAASPLPAWSQADERFFWNLNLISPLINDAQASPFILPVTNMWTGSCSFPSLHCNLTLLSRRSRLRQGPRYVKRGVDAHGDVANFVETEHILRHTNGQIAAFTQIRGSIPIFWKQTEWWRLRPLIVPLFDNVKLHILALKSHILELFHTYIASPAYEPPPLTAAPAIVLVNLIDKHGGQGNLGRWLTAALQGLSRRVTFLSSSESAEGLPHRIVRDSRYNDRKSILVDDVKCTVESEDKGTSVTAASVPLRHVWFDYHKKCKLDFATVKELFPLVFPKGRVGTQDYLHVNANGSIRHLQQRIVRTNCIDCLDRTNVVQTTISRWVLLQQLQAMGAPCPSEADALALPDQVIL